MQQVYLQSETQYLGRCELKSFSKYIVRYAKKIARMKPTYDGDQVGENCFDISMFQTLANALPHYSLLTRKNTSMQNMENMAIQW